MNTPPINLSISDELLRKELDQSSTRFHVIGAWVAIIFDPLFAVTDYFNIPNHWQQLLAIRLGISCILALALWAWKRKEYPSFYLVMLAFMLISLQNAYTFSLIGNDLLTGHCLNYMALLLGAAMFLLWSYEFSLAIVGISALATVYFVSGNPDINPDLFWVKGGLLLLVMGLFMILLIKARYDLTLKEIRARLQLEFTNDELANQKAIVEHSNALLTSSIQYAKRIQESVLGSPSQINDWFSGAFCLFQSRDILSGDFYWFYEDAEEEIKVVIAADCTGHGVPAALMTMMGNSILNEIVVQRKIFSPDRILHELDVRVTESLGNTDAGERVDDGMEIGILVFHQERVLFSAAMSSLFLIHKGELEVVKGSRFSIGNQHIKREKTFSLHEIDYDQGDRFYLFSDGFQDQFGGDNDRKYSTSRFKDLLIRTSHLPMPLQREKLNEELHSWKGANRQTDDILVVGVEV